MANKNILSINELLKETYSVLKKRHRPEEIILPARAWAEIAADIDERYGYIIYEKIGLFHFDKTEWAIALGKSSGGYLVENYDSDILAVEFSAENKEKEEVQKELTKIIEKSRYFKNSLIQGLSDGRLAVREYGNNGEPLRFGRSMKSVLEKCAYKYTEKEPKYNREFLDLSTLRPMCTESAKYKNEFADFLADSIENVLKASTELKTIDNYL